MAESRNAKKKQKNNPGVNSRITQYSIFTDFYTTTSCITIMITSKLLRARYHTAAVPASGLQGALFGISQSSRQGILQFN